jgi:hypothetical protein
MVAGDPAFVAGPKPELDIVVWAVRAPTPDESSRRAQQIFDLAAKNDLHLALARLPGDYFQNAGWQPQENENTLTCLRSVLMKPEHLAWIQEIWTRLKRAAAKTT